MTFIKRIRGAGVLLGAVLAVAAGVFWLQRAEATDPDISVELNGRWHVEGETFWFGQPGDVFLFANWSEWGNLGAGGSPGVWRNGEVFLAKSGPWGEVAEVAHSFRFGEPGDIPISIVQKCGGPQFFAIIRDDVIHYSDFEGNEVGTVTWPRPGWAACIGLAPNTRPDILAPVGGLKAALDAGQGLGHEFVLWPVRLDGFGKYVCESPVLRLWPFTFIKGARAELTLCTLPEVIVEDSRMENFTINGSAVVQGETYFLDMRVDSVLVENGVTRFLDSTASSIDVFGGELRVEGSQITAEVILRTTQPVVFIDSLVGTPVNRAPIQLGEILFFAPERVSVADVTLIDTRAKYDFVSVTCIDFYESFC